MICGHYSWKRRASGKAYKINKNIQNYVKGKCLPGSRKSLTVSVTVCFPHLQVLSFSRGWSCSSVFLGGTVSLCVPSIACRLCWNSDTLFLLRHQQNNDKKSLIWEWSFSISPKPGLLAVKTLWNSSAPFPVVRGVASSSLLLSLLNRISLVYHYFSMPVFFLFFFFLILCSELFTPR